MTFATTKNGTTARTERMRIDNTGNVGIGTTTPAYPLSVNGVIQSTTGGFKFPDGSTQTSAASGVALSSPDSSITVGGSGAAPTVAVNTSVIQKRVEQHLLQRQRHRLHQQHGHGQLPDGQRRRRRQPAGELEQHGSRAQRRAQRHQHQQRARRPRRNHPSPSFFATVPSRDCRHGDRNRSHSRGHGYGDAAPAVLASSDTPPHPSVGVVACNGRHRIHGQPATATRRRRSSPNMANGGGDVIEADADCDHGSNLHAEVRTIAVDQIIDAQGEATSGQITAFDGRLSQPIRHRSPTQLRSSPDLRKLHQRWCQLQRHQCLPILQRGRQRGRQLQRKSPRGRNHLQGRRHVQDRPSPRPRQQVSLPLLRRVARHDEHLQRHCRTRQARQGRRSSCPAISRLSIRTSAIN